ncbi:MAG: hypothetical protein ACFB21_14055 [Opitutales bacterium]
MQKRWYGVCVSLVMASIHQLNPSLLVTTPLGKGLALLVIDYGMGVNSCWAVALKANGQIKHFDSNDVYLSANPTYGVNLSHEKPPRGRPSAANSGEPGVNGDQRSA